MESQNKTIEELLVSVEDYSKTGIELISLKFVDRTSGILAKLIVYFILIVTFSFFLLLISVGASLWIGELLGSAFYGFFIVAGFYALLGLFFLLALPNIVRGIKTSIISQMLN